MNLSPRNKLIITAVAAALAVVVLIVVLVVPSFQKLGAIRSDIEAASADSDTANMLLKQRRQVKDQAAATDTRILQLAVAVPENPDLPSLIIDLQDLAHDSGVVLRKVQPDEPVRPDGTIPIGIPIELSVWGTWGDTVDYLQQLRRLPRQLRVLSFNTTPLTESDLEADTSSGITTPPYYQVKTIINVYAYVIPAGSITTTTVPTPAAAPE